MKLMFFRRERQRVPSFEERLAALEKAGFTVTRQSSGGVLVRRADCAAVIQENGVRIRSVGRAGLWMGEEIGVLVDGGFQKFFEAPSGKRRPALADNLKAIHEFEEDLKEGLGLESLYNESLGTVSTLYLYDRLKDRDAGIPKRVWETGRT